jgi:predicted RNA-binding Zn-ribbon protein involved in translation (DUF1610 family)
MKCPYCDAEFEVQDLDDYQDELSKHGQEGVSWGDGVENAYEEWASHEEDDFAGGSCPSCGAEIIGSENTIASVCPCCGNAQIIKRRITGLLKPDLVIPFKLDKAAAVEALKKFCAKKRLLPDSFKGEERLSEIVALYVPFWLFDARARGHIRYRATRSKVYSDSDFTYTRTDYFSVVRDGTIDFEKIPVDGSAKIDNAYMNAIEPFDYKDFKDFRPAFLAGYQAEKHDVSSEEGREDASVRMKGSIEDEFFMSARGNYQTINTESSHITVENGKVHYSLMPVWILNAKHKEKNEDKIYTFMVNGQSGRIAGKLPCDSKKRWKYRFLLTAIIGVSLSIALQALRLFM